MLALRTRLALALLASPLWAAACVPAAQTAVEIGPPPGDPRTDDPAAAPEKPHDPEPGCSWTGPQLYARAEGLPLCFAVDGACFANASSPFTGAVLVTIPAGKPQETGAKIDLADFGVRLTAWTSGDAMLLFPLRPIVFAGVVVPAGADGLFVERVRPGSVDLAYQGDAQLRPRNGMLHAHAACRDIGTSPVFRHPEEARTAAGVLAGPDADMVIPADRVLALSAVPGGPALADIVSPSGGALVELAEQTGPWSRILWWKDGSLVLGWVDGAALTPAPPQSAAPPPTGPVPAAAPNYTVQPGAGTRCPIEMPLFAEMAGVVQEVGVLLAGTRFTTGRPTSLEHTEVHLRTHTLDLLPGAKWLVQTAKLDGCTIE